MSSPAIPRTDPAVIFDMDGVLIDSYHPHWLSWRETCRQRGIQMSREQYDSLFGRSFRAFAETLCGDTLTEQELTDWYWDKEASYREMIRKDFPAVPGASELIAALHDEGFALGIASSGPRDNVDCLLTLLEGAQHMRATISADETTEAKPHPEPFLACSELLGVSPSACAVIEDSTHGLKGARSAGMVAVGLVGTCPPEELKPYADCVVHSLRELNPQGLKTLIAEKNARLCAIRENLSPEM